MEDLKLQEWQKLTIEALAGQRARIAQTIAGINEAIQHYAEEWADGQKDPSWPWRLEFEQRPDGLYLVSKDETELAPAT